MSERQIHELAQQLYESEPPKPLQPWANLSESTQEHYCQYARNLMARFSTEEKS